MINNVKTNRVHLPTNLQVRCNVLTLSCSVSNRLENPQLPVVDWRNSSRRHFRPARFRFVRRGAAA